MCFFQLKVNYNNKKKKKNQKIKEKTHSNTFNTLKKCMLHYTEMKIVRDISTVNVLITEIIYYF